MGGHPSHEPKAQGALDRVVNLRFGASLALPTNLRFRASFLVRCSSGSCAATFLRFRASYMTPSAPRTLRSPRTRDRGSLNSREKGRPKSRKTGAPHRALPHHHLSCWERGRPCPAGCRESAVRSISCRVPSAGRSDRSRLIGRCRCLAIGNVYRGCDRSGPWSKNAKNSGVLRDPATRPVRVRAQPRVARFVAVERRAPARAARSMRSATSAASWPAA